MILNIVKNNDLNSNLLRKKNQDFEKNTDLRTLTNDMFETLELNNGIGLAAPQIGVNKNLFIVKTPDFKEVFINPKIKLKGIDIKVIEGCLSVPNQQCEIKRKNSVMIEYYDINWKKRKTQFNDLIAIIIQHEYDHLLGKLIVDY